MQPITKLLFRTRQNKFEHKQIMNKQLYEHVYFNRLFEGMEMH